MLLTHRIQWLLIVILLVGPATLPVMAQPAETPASNVTLQPEKESWFFRGTDNLTTLIGYGLVFIASLLAYRQWRRDQQWKRLEALMQRIKAFTETPGSLNAMMMLSSDDREVPLWDKEKPEERYVRVSWEEVSRALIPTDMLKYPYDSKQSAIRDSFNDLLGRLSHLEAFLEAELLSENEAKHAMKNFVLQFERLILQNTDLARNLRIYINYYGMDGVQNLFKRFDIDLKQNINEEQEQLKREIDSGKWNLPT